MHAQAKHTYSQMHEHGHMHVHTYTVSSSPSDAGNLSDAEFLRFFLLSSAENKAALSKVTQAGLEMCTWLL